jgi:hypothetical protein
MDNRDEKGAKGAGDESSPMAMCMEMARKMMSQMGAGGSPMEMMQKMMAKMGGQAEDKPQMEKMMSMCIGMCSEMMGMIGMMGMAQHVEGRIAFLKAELKITEAQMPQWNAFAEALRANARGMSEMPTTMMGQGSASVSAPDRLDRMEKMMSATLEAVKGAKIALAPLYAVFTEEQKKVADQLIHGPMGIGPM